MCAISLLASYIFIPSAPSDFVDEAASGAKHRAARAKRAIPRTGPWKQQKQQKIRSSCHIWRSENLTSHLLELYLHPKNSEFEEKLLQSAALQEEPFDGNALKPVLQKSQNQWKSLDRCLRDHHRLWRHGTEAETRGFYVLLSWA